MQTDNSPDFAESILFIGFQGRRQRPKPGRRGIISHCIPDLGIFFFIKVISPYGQVNQVLWSCQLENIKDNGKCNKPISIENSVLHWKHRNRSLSHLTFELPREHELQQERQRTKKPHSVSQQLCKAGISILILQIECKLLTSDPYSYHGTGTPSELAGKRRGRDGGREKGREGKN